MPPSPPKNTHPARAESPQCTQQRLADVSTVPRCFRVGVLNVVEKNVIDWATRRVSILECADGRSRDIMDTGVPTLPPDVFESVVNALADALIRDYRERWSGRRRSADPANVSTNSVAGPTPTWLTIADAAKRAQCSEATIRREVRAGRLRTVKVGGRRSLRFRAQWIDEWLQAASIPR